MKVGMVVVFVFEKNVLRLICGYAPHSGGSLEEIQSFYVELKNELDMYGVWLSSVLG